MTLPDCIGKPCQKTIFDTSDLRLERYQIDGDLDAQGRQRVYDWPAPDSGFANSGFFPAQRQAFDTKAGEEIGKYADPVYSKCQGDCTCGEPQQDPKEIPGVVTRVPVEANYTFPDQNGTATLFGSFKLVTKAIPSLCTAGYRVGMFHDFGRDYFLAASAVATFGLSDRALETIKLVKPQNESKSSKTRIK